MRLCLYLGVYVIFVNRAINQVQVEKVCPLCAPRIWYMVPAVSDDGVSSRGLIQPDEPPDVVVSGGLMESLFEKAHTLAFRWHWH